MKYYVDIDLRQGRPPWKEDQVPPATTDSGARRHPYARTPTSPSRTISGSSLSSFWCSSSMNSTNPQISYHLILITYE
jgi:hypothetical protein